MQLSSKTNFLKNFSFMLVATFLVIGIQANSFAITKKDLRRVDESGSVEVVVLYLNPLKQTEDKEIAFEITLDTHSADLSQYKLEEVSFVRVGGGPEIKASGWLNPGGGGHHKSGTVTFETTVSPSADSLELIVRGVGGVEERVFKWKLPVE